MSGIVGLANISDSSDLIQRALPAILHRGTKIQVIKKYGVCSLGACISSGNEYDVCREFYSKKSGGTVTILFDGKLYNSKELCHSLCSRGVQLTSLNDTDIIFNLYETYGMEFISQLNGAFALAVYDKHNDYLFLVRDRLGIKPLYYESVHRGLAFASEIKALDELGSRRYFDPAGLLQTLTYGNQFGSTTMTKNVKALEPGQVLSFCNGTISFTYFYKLCIKPCDINFEDACEIYKKTVLSAISRCIADKENIAAYVSSGFDSSSVAALTSAYKKVSTFTGIFESTGWYDERIGAQAVADKIESNHTNVLIDGRNLPAIVENVAKALDEPRMGFGALSQYTVAEQVAPTHQIVLTGHGGDEFFAGYPQFKLAQLEQLNLMGKIIFCSKVRFSELPHIAYFTGRKLFFTGQQLPMPIIIENRLLRSLLRPELNAVLKDILPEEEGLRLLETSPDDNFYEVLLRSYIKLYMPGLFVVEDRISMAHGLEARTPLCDNELLDLALKIPLRTKLNGGVLKAIPKNSMRGILPDILWQLPKRGFPTPLSYWLRTAHRDWLREKLGSSSPLNNIFIPSKLSALVENYISSPLKMIRPLDEIPTHRIWLLLVLDSCMRRRNLQWK